ncbi:MAG TPA: hypothetical protein VGC95_13820 [Chitinophagaceae bacterium]
MKQRRVRRFATAYESQELLRSSERLDWRDIRLNREFPCHDETPDRPVFPASRTGRNFP